MMMIEFAFPTCVCINQLSAAASTARLCKVFNYGSHAEANPISHSAQCETVST